MDTEVLTSPVIKRLQLRAPALRAFEHFTKHISLWWPLAGHSLSGAEALEVCFEAFEGGAIYETDRQGRRREWGRVLVCEPPHRLVFSWILERPESATEVEVLFEPDGDNNTAFTLIHRGWERVAGGAGRRGSYEQGWPGVLARYRESLAGARTAAARMRAGRVFRLHGGGIPGRTKLDRGMASRRRHATDDDAADCRG